MYNIAEIQRMQKKNVDSYTKVLQKKNNNVNHANIDTHTNKD